MFALVFLGEYFRMRDGSDEHLQLNSGLRQIIFCDLHVPIAFVYSSRPYVPYDHELSKESWQGHSKIALCISTALFQPLMVMSEI